jgi:D-alanyl-lipoteichoic acid acyltransferase DltB (MBOAT superfamily)
MTFNSATYIFLFLPVAILGFWLLSRAGRPNAPRLWLLAVSLVFYGLFDWTLVPMLMVSLAFNHVISRLIRPGPTDGKNRKHWLVAGIALNLCALAGFKYTDFFIQNLNVLFASGFDLWNLMLPLGISFITFQQIAYLVQRYRGQLEQHDWLDYALMVIFFPKIISGPIADPKALLPQFKACIQAQPNWDRLALGLYLFAIGLVKKTLFGDMLSVIVQSGYDATASLSGLEAWITSLAYTFQLYFDFSGYTDMALGSALMLNIALPQNFNSPYKATNFQDFWRRWHITLSLWLRDYLYIPLGGNRGAEWRVHTNLLITFLLGGLWHGAAWTFVLWGAVHGLGNSVNRLWKRTGLNLPRIPAIALTFLVVNLAWVPFRAPSLNDALNVFRGMLGLNGWSGLTAFESVSSMDQALTVLLGTLGAAIIWLAPSSAQQSERFSPNRRRAVFTAALLVVGLIFINSSIPKEFLYFDF